MVNLFTLNKLSSKSDLVMCLVRVMTLQCSNLNILVKASHVEGRLNTVCDALSRFQLDKFAQLAPEADPLPSTVPEVLWDIFDLEPANYFNMD